MECTMVKNPDEIKGRVKEAAGSLTGNKKLKSEGKADRLAGAAKAKVKKAEVRVRLGERRAGTGEETGLKSVMVAVSRVARDCFR
jgi:uncharacterized protein YjbJ (UPF0337 family)